LARSDDCRREGRHINLSLHHLEQVVMALNRQEKLIKNHTRKNNHKSSSSSSSIQERDGSSSSIPSNGSGSHTRNSKNRLSQMSYVGGRKKREYHLSSSSNQSTSSSSNRSISTSSSYSSSVTNNRSHNHNPTSSTLPHIHIPYRNSTMTSILRDSLGGNTRTIFLVTINPEADALEETVYLDYIYMIFLRNLNVII